MRNTRVGVTSRTPRTRTITRVCTSVDRVCMYERVAQSICAEQMYFYDDNGDLTNKKIKTVRVDGVYGDSRCTVTEPKMFLRVYCATIERFMLCVPTYM